MDYRVICTEFSVDMEKGPSVFDVTDRLTDMIRESGIAEGMLAACNIGSTGSLTTIEFEPGVVQDLKNAIERLAPRDAEYMHELAWHDGNGHSHVQAALLGPSICLQIRNGKPVLGTWQQVVAINHDNMARKRRIAVTITGKTGE